MSGDTPQLFNGGESLPATLQHDAAAVARATQEIQAALVIGQRFPRDEVRAKARILEACKRKELAEVAEYEYSRGGTRITGPTIDLLRAIANRWGNIRFGWSEVERQPAGNNPAGRSMVRCFAWDMQSNGQAERTFAVSHWRDTQAGGYALEDERDIYELIANQAARRVRACLEEVIDADIVNSAVDACRVTLKTGERVPLADRAVQMVSAFSEFGVTQAMIETRLGNKLDAVSENQLASLRRVYKAMKDGVGQREDYFKPEAAKPVLPTDEQPEPKPEPEPLPEPQPPAPAEKPKQPGKRSEGFNPLKAVRNLCTMSKIKEGQVLNQLAAEGTTDGSIGSLEELALGPQGLHVLTALAEDWAEFVGRLKTRKEKD